ncbi:bifunctional 2',3'-cyclic-nucleotide 2'-phosphodiesterase/3'-nucleotidase [Methylosinus sp. H3A]|uniref:bifunctional 2',3'-cyclic-nucleotide 2'-phosphodiesterase/3'-nucleotidase n=1 Tax=Methylosinus sp. H3A TaxID=2785786 RepID=UPI0018C2CB3E|nr:bifunctional 2',3'-cyclic-nucleotide 2'-phosphodiesterase/3'-nucleotidase [Methylosinus sp. H3A]MBG0812474.1 bifunctional 2',3'-cyclic-nucleotide 2'-phosphodiesterase/3'-nucleotidase [Methylosinus sp. H3A]
MPITRRELLAGGAALTANFPTIARAATRVQLRLLETSDLHMFVLDWDYYHARPDPTVGLNKIASLVAEARAQTQDALLFDNGDLLQGSPLGDYVARLGGLGPGAHPVFRAMNHMRYDVATPGNHEFNFGLDFLERALSGAAFPYVGANIERADGSAFLPPFRILTRRLMDDGGVSRELRIGVIGFAPPQIMIWDKAHLEGRLRCGDMVAAARRHVPILRAQCDILVALCHSGIDARAAAGAENACLQIAAIPGVDAIMMGHAHRVFPGPDYTGVEGVDAERGTLAGVPAVMPGFWGSHLGVIDLTLARDGDRWTVDRFRTEARPIYQRETGKVIALADADPTIATIVAAEHDATRRWVDEPIGEIATPLFSYFVWIGIDPVGALVNAAQLAYVRPLLEGTPHAGLPLLSAIAPFRAGYTPDSYIDLGPGPVALRDVADIYPYPNALVAVRVTGAALREWLECAARVFRRVDRDATGPQLLIDRRTPSYHFDVIAGLQYRIDLSAPARYDASGNLRPDAARIVDLRYGGSAVDPAQEFIVVTNNYRADGGGKFPGLDGRSVVLRAPDSNRDAVERFLRRGGAIPDARPWSFAPLGRRVTIAFDSAPAAVRRLAETPGLRATTREDAGYLRYEYDLA